MEHAKQRNKTRELLAGWFWGTLGLVAFFALGWAFFRSYGDAHSWHEKVGASLQQDGAGIVVWVKPCGDGVLVYDVTVSVHVPGEGSRIAWRIVSRDGSAERRFPAAPETVGFETFTYEPALLADGVFFQYSVTLRGGRLHHRDGSLETVKLNRTDLRVDRVLSDEKLWIEDDYRVHGTCTAGTGQGPS